ncbi:YraN family protein [bacterium]|nr:MAG: YraN family protein [bacterium]
MTIDKITLGKRGEDEAEKFLKKLGYKIIERNYRCSFGEVDIIAKDNYTIVFFEVKTRSNDNYGSPKCAVDWRKQKKVMAAGSEYLSRKNLNDTLVRFDVISVEAKSGAMVIEHVKDAFEGEG